MTGGNPFYALQVARELASLAAEGLANKEIVAALHMSVHAVEEHLTRIYRKLDICSRAALAGRLASTKHPEATSEDRQVRPWPGVPPETHR